MKSYPAAQVPLIESPHAEPLYFAHIYLETETLYFSDRNFPFNGHDYEAYLLDIPSTAQSIERFGGYLNISAQLTFRNARFRSYVRLFDFFLDNPLVKREMDLFVLYLKDGALPAADVSTKLHRVSFGEFCKLQTETFGVNLSSILFAIDQKQLFTQIGRDNWPNAAPDAIGEFENRLIGSLKNIPCHCVDTGAATTVYAMLLPDANQVYLTDVDYPMPFPSSGTIQIDDEKINYTGKDSVNKKLTGLSRGQSSTAPAVHKPGAVAWIIKSSYKYLIDSGKIKEVSNVYISQTRVNPSDYSINLDDSGKSTVSFTKKALNKHTHGQKAIFEMRPVSATHENLYGEIYWQGLDSTMMDKDENTWQRWGYSGAIPLAYTGDMILNFGSYTGEQPDAVYVCLVIFSAFTGVNGEYTMLAAPEQINIGQTAKATIRIKLASTTVPTQIKVRGHTNAVPSGGHYEINLYEAWIEVERYSSGASGSADEVLAPMVTVDAKGYADSGAAIYTGSANALIENPSDVLRYLLVGVAGRSMSEIDASFETVRNTMASRISGGYKIAALLSKLGSSPMEVFKAIQAQSRSQMREDGGKFLLSFDSMPTYTKILTDALPSGGSGISASSAYAGYQASKSCDNTSGTAWVANTTALPQWVQWDRGEGIEQIVWKLTVEPFFSIAARAKDFILKGSHDGITFFDVLTGQHANTSAGESYLISDRRAFRVHRLYVTSSWATGQEPGIAEWELFPVTDETPAATSCMDIDADVFEGDPVFNFTPASQIKNLIRVVFDLSYSINGSSRKFGDYLQQIKIGDGDLPEDLALSGVASADMAEDVAWWHLTGKSNSFPMVELLCKRRVAALERGDHFTLYDTPVAAWEGSLWKILEIKPTPDRQRFTIIAIKRTVE